jgi:hypothetical protein
VNLLQCRHPGRPEASSSGRALKVMMQCNESGSGIVLSRRDAPAPQPFDAPPEGCRHKTVKVAPGSSRFNHVTAK